MNDHNSILWVRNTYQPYQRYWVIWFMNSIVQYMVLNTGNTFLLSSRVSFDDIILWYTKVGSGSPISLHVTLHFDETE